MITTPITISGAIVLLAIVTIRQLIREVVSLRSDRQKQAFALKVIAAGKDPARILRAMNPRRPRRHGRPQVDPPHTGL